MNTKCLAATLAMAGASLCAGQSATEQRATVTVCIEPDPHALMGVRPMVSTMFASIGVTIDWHWQESCPAGVGAIQVRMSHDSHSVRDLKALAIARPSEGSVVVFLDRVQALDRSGVRSVMAHVLVHEITHVLQRIDRHSATGIMKARWDGHDYLEMRFKPLPFAQEDVDLIYDGLKAPRVSPSSVVMRAAVAGH